MPEKYPDQGVFVKDKSWDAMKVEEEETFKKYPGFFEALIAEASKNGINMEEMFFEVIYGEGGNEVEVQYYPYAIDWSLNATWDIDQKKLVEFIYNDNFND